MMVDLSAEIAVFLMCIGPCQIYGQCVRDSSGTWKCQSHCERNISDSRKCICDTRHGWSGVVRRLCQRRNIISHQDVGQSRTRATYRAELAVDSDIDTVAWTARVNNPYWFGKFEEGRAARVKWLQLTIGPNFNDIFEIHVKNDSLDLDDSSLCVRKYFSIDTPKDTWDIICSKTLVGDTLVVTVSRNRASLKLFDVKVFGCQNGTFGSKCESLCPSYCPDGCSIDTGECMECRTPGCVHCPSGKFGPMCEFSCPPGCSNGECDYFNGVCISCKKGYRGRFCNAFAADPSKGDKCKFCKGEKCNDIGHCTSCEKGSYGQFCNQTCSINCHGDNSCAQESGECTVCKNSKYGPFCEYHCSTKCKDLHCLRNGTCKSGCLTGWVGHKCDKRCWPKACVECKEEEMKTSVCTRCEESWFIKDNTCEKCPKNCLSCQSEDECSVCLPGFFGKTCSNFCGQNCRNATCGKNGECTFGCVLGYFGPNCSRKCEGNLTDCDDWDDHCVFASQNRKHSLIPDGDKSEVCNETGCLRCDDGSFMSLCEVCHLNCDICINASSCTGCKVGKCRGVCDHDCSLQPLLCSEKTKCLVSNISEEDNSRVRNKSISGFTIHQTEGLPLAAGLIALTLLLILA